MTLINLTPQELRDVIQKAVDKAVQLAVADERSKRVGAESDRDYYKKKDAADIAGEWEWGLGGVATGTVLGLLVKR